MKPPFVCTSTFNLWKAVSSSDVSLLLSASPPLSLSPLSFSPLCFTFLPPPGTLVGSPWGFSDAAAEAQPTPTTGVAPGARLAFMDLSAGSSDLVRVAGTLRWVQWLEPYAGCAPPGHTLCSRTLTLGALMGVHTTPLSAGGSDLMKM